MSRRSDGKKMVVSAKRVEANRRNALLSSGPSSVRGKAVSSQNPVTHGLSKGVGLIQGENAEEFQEFQKAYFRDLAPVGAHEHCLALQIIWLAWKLNVRFQKMEAAAMRVLEFKRLEQEHRQRYEMKALETDRVIVQSLTDSALADEAQTFADVDNRDPDLRLEKIARGRSVGPKFLGIVDEYLQSDGASGFVGAQRLDALERKQKILEAEAARRSALSEENSLGRELIYDIETGRNVLDKVHRYSRETLTDYIKVTREFERIKARRKGEVVAGVLAVDINVAKGEQP